MVTQTCMKGENEEKEGENELNKRDAEAGKAKLFIEASRRILKCE